MKKRLITIKIVLSLLLISSIPNVTFANSFHSQDESFKLYFSTGSAIPIGDASDILKFGYHFSSGIGIVLSSKSKISPELNIMFSFNHLKTKSQDTYVTNIYSNYIIPNSHENTNYFSFESRFRVENNRRIRPYVTVGIGLASGSYLFPNTVSIVGIGVDIATTNNGARPFYSEFRLMKSKYNYIVLSIGTRIG